MKNKLLLDVISILLKFITGLIPVGIGAALYYYAKVDLFWVIAFFFFILNRNVFEVFELSNKIHDSKKEEEKIWRNILTKRKAL